MKPTSPPAPAAQAPADELAALRLENQQLRATQAAHLASQTADDRYEQRQVRFRTVFEHSPLGNKIIDKELTIK